MTTGDGHGMARWISASHPDSPLPRSADLALSLLYQRHDQRCHDVDNLDRRVDGGFGGLLVRITCRFPVSAALARFLSLAAIPAFPDGRSVVARPHCRRRRDTARG